MPDGEERHVVRPADPGELAGILAEANTGGLGVCIVGGGTKLAWGNRPERLDLLVSTCCLSSTCEIDADDLTATLSAGVTVAEARARARATDRILPLDAGLPGLATVGGVAATGDQGVRGAGYGRVRDLVLGLRAVLADGTAVKFGGRTMKNVAGYDMTKLFVGSFGALGVITEITFRLLPRADAQRLAVLPLGALEEAQRIASAVLDSPLQPLVLAAVSPDVLAAFGAAAAMVMPAGGAEVVLLAGFSGHEAAVERSVRDVSAWSGSRASVVLRDDEVDTLLDALADYGLADGAQGTVGDAAEGATGAAQSGAGAAAERAVDYAALLAGHGGGLKLRASVPISRVWALTAKARDSAAAAGLSLSYRVDGAWGMLDLWVRASRDDEVRLGDAGTGSYPGSFVASLRAEAEKAGGWLAVTGGSAWLPAGHDAWGAVEPSLRLMKGLKERFDPKRTLNPGRFVGGI